MMLFNHFDERPWQINTSKDICPQLWVHLDHFKFSGVELPRLVEYLCRYCDFSNIVDQGSEPDSETLLLWKPPYFRDLFGQIGNIRLVLACVFISHFECSANCRYHSCQYFFRSLVIERFFSIIVSIRNFR